MAAFNETLWNEVEQSGLFRMAPRTSYPLQVPQRPQDIRGGQAPAAAPTTPPRRGAAPRPGRAAYRHVPFGLGWASGERELSCIRVHGRAERTPGVDGLLLQRDPARCRQRAGLREDLQRIAERRWSEAGSAGICGRHFEAVRLESLAGSKVLFVSTRTGAKEIWAMDYDGTNQRPITKYRSISTTPAVRPMARAWRLRRMYAVNRRSRCSRLKHSANSSFSTRTLP